MIKAKNMKKSNVGEELLKDWYQRTAQAGGSFFGVDTGKDQSALVDCRREADEKNIELWERGFDIDFYVSTENNGTETRVYHEVKTFSRTLESKAKEQTMWNPVSKKKEQVIINNRGYLALEIISDGRALYKNREIDEKTGRAIEQIDQVPGTDQTSKHLYGTSCFYKGTTRANWYHFYLPVVRENKPTEGLTEAKTSEYQAMLQATKATGQRKLIMEAPAGLYISLSRAVLDEYLKLALEEFNSKYYKKGLTFQERREIIEEYFKDDQEEIDPDTGKLMQICTAINIKIHATRLSEAWSKAIEKNGELARLETRPVFQFCRGGNHPEREIEIAEDMREYLIPERLKSVCLTPEILFGKGFRTPADYIGRVLDVRAV